MHEYLGDEGFEVLHTASGSSAIEFILEHNPAATILDVMLPGVDGVEICRKLKEVYHNPIIMLTASNNEYAEIAALNYGADKFLHKPLKPQVLLAHLKSSLSGVSSKLEQRKEIVLDSSKRLVLDHVLKQAFFDKKDIQLSACEFKLLALLETRSGQPFTRDEIFQELRGFEYDGSDRYVDLQVSSLRKKMGDTKPPFKSIKTMRSLGYYLVEGL